MVEGVSVFDQISKQTKKVRVEYKRKHVQNKLGPIFKGVSEEQLDQFLNGFVTNKDIGDPQMEIGQIDNELKMNITFNQEMLAPSGEIDQSQYSDLLQINIVTEADVDLIPSTSKSRRLL